MNRSSRDNVELQTGLLCGEKAVEYEAQIERIERLAFPDPWSVRNIRETLEQNRYLNLGVWKEGILCGYLFFSYVLDEGEIVRIAVDPSVRRKGAATQLFQELRNCCMERQISKIMLDVRADNISAISFYHAMEFEVDGCRKNFYTNPTEDAILMSCRIG